jgi:6-pyruvoyl-tetrahydropterin synthase
MLFRSSVYLRFDAEHYLASRPATDRRGLLHLHTWTGKITVASRATHAGGEWAACMVDHDWLTELIQARCIRVLDGSQLNKVLQKTTPEAICKWMAGRLRNEIAAGSSHTVRLLKVTINTTCLPRVELILPNEYAKLMEG